MTNIKAINYKPLGTLSKLKLITHEMRENNKQLQAKLAKMEAHLKTIKDAFKL